MLILTQPLWLLLLVPVALALVLWHRRSSHPMPLPRRRGDLALRLAVAVALLLALAGPRRLQEGLTPALVLVADHSASLGDTGWAEQTRRAHQLLVGQDAGTPWALVSAGATPRLLRSLATGPWQDPVRPASEEQTDLAAALRLAAGLAGDERGQRLLLLSDGWQTVGDAAAAAREAAGRGLRLDAVAVVGESRPDARLAALRTSHERLHRGATLSLEAEAIGNISGPAQVRLFENGIAVAEQAVALVAGVPATVRFQRQPARRGITSYRAVLAGVTDDSLPANDEALAWIDVRGEPLALCLVEAEEDASALRRACAAEGVALDLRRADASAPRSLPELIGYDAVILANIGAAALGEERMQALRDYVEHFGGGLLMIGGERSFGVGGYYRTPIEELLPVKMRPKDREDRRSTALCLVLDRSGSMDGEKLQMCKAAAIATAQLLQGKDHLAVIAFDSEPYEVVAMARASATAVSAIESIASGGGTDIHAGMQAGWHALRQVQAGVKHMLLLTDGHGQGGDYDNLVAGLRQDGISISTVAVGSDSDVQLLQRLAQQGGGTSYANAAPEDLKAIFTQDAMRHLGRMINEDPFVPQLAEAHPMLAGWSEPPPLLGYVTTERRPAAQVLLTAGQGEPLLAHWRFGLGKVTAFTSGCGARWAPLWIATWPGYAPFWSQVIRETMRPPQGHFLDVALSAADGEALIAVDLLGDAVSHADRAAVEATVHHLPPHALGARGKELATLACDQVGPGRYAARFPLTEPGVYVVQVRAGNRLASAGLVHAVPREAALGMADRASLQAWSESTGGVLLDDAATALPPWPGARAGRAWQDWRDPLLIAAILLLLALVSLRRWEAIRDQLGGGT